MGEAEKPGPLAGFDDASQRAWSEPEEEEEQPEDWFSPPSDHETEPEEATADAGAAEATKEKKDAWEVLHANVSFVPTKNKRITKQSKFDGARPGWVFKSGDQGLGYYRDNGGLRTQLSLDLALHPLRSVPVATISLDGLVPGAPNREPRASGSSGGGWGE